MYMYISSIVCYVHCIYMCTPHRHLCRLQCSVTRRDLVLAWQRESWWTYSGALSSEVDRERYWEVVCRALRKHFSQSDLVSTWQLSYIYMY